ncbi:MAG: hypothetical protein ABI947_06070 [Chloroflexota bacterium]
MPVSQVLGMRFVEQRRQCNKTGLAERTATGREAPTNMADTGRGQLRAMP